MKTNMCPDLLPAISLSFCFPSCHSRRLMPSLTAYQSSHVFWHDHAHGAPVSTAPQVPAPLPRALPGPFELVSHCAPLLLTRRDRQREGEKEADRAAAAAKDRARAIRAEEAGSDDSEEDVDLWRRPALSSK